MKLILGRIESLAVTGIAFRFSQEVEKRNHDIRMVMAEHGIHRVPDTYILHNNADGYIEAIEWEEEASDAQA